MTVLMCGLPYKSSQISNNESQNRFDYGKVCLSIRTAYCKGINLVFIYISLMFWTLVLVLVRMHLSFVICTSGVIRPLSDEKLSGRQAKLNSFFYSAHKLLIGT